MGFYAKILRFNHWTNRFYHRWSGRKDHLATYHRMLGECLSESNEAVHVGAGGRDPTELIGHPLDDVKIWAVDPSAESLARSPNPNKLEAWGHDIPLPDESVDCVFSEYVMEHVEDPVATVREARRILRPGGQLLWMAPNLWSYSGIATHLTPHGFHIWFNRLLEPTTPERTTADVFPTYFRINSIRSIRRILRDEGFEIEELLCVAYVPHYTQAIPIVHQFAIVLHLLLDYFSWLRPFRMVQIVKARRI
ncbi:MAG: methyltransferase domain-containing protein [bacterium]|nr:methyltransferase domain-containing protein [bacterium]